MSPDPVGFVESNPMSFNRYAYVNNNPYKYVDPDGEFLNFAAKFVLDVGVNVAFNYVTTGSFGVGAALKESAAGVLNPAKTVAKMGKLGMALSKGARKLDNLDPCPLSCFVAGTTVLAERGHVPIETLREGDLVWAHDPETGETALKPIVRTFVNTNDSVWQLTIEKEGIRYLHEVTGSHPYYVIGQGWVEVAELSVEAALLTEDGATATVTSLRNTGQILTTYNFEVADIHTYYVSAAKVLVHNCGGRSGKQARLRELAGDDKLGSADRGWLKQELNAIARGTRDTLRVPPGKQLAHERGRESAKGYGYEHSQLQDKSLHRTQHKYDDWGRANKERPPQN